MTENGEERKLPEGWARVPLEECVEILDKHRVPVNSKEREERIADKSSEQLFPYYGATGQVGVIDDFLFDEELVLLGEDGAPFLDPFKGVAYLVNGKTWVNNHAHVLKAIPGITANRYLLHYLNQVEYREFVTGTTRLKLTQGQMKAIPVRLPPSPEQERIVDKIEELFSDLDAGVKALETVRRQLDRYRQSVLKAAVEGDLTREWREQHGADLEPAEALLERIPDERRARWEADYAAKYEAKGKTPPKGWQSRYKEPEAPDTSSLPKLPEGWVWVSVQHVGDVQLGRQRSPKDHHGEYMRPYLRVANVYEDRIDTSDVMEMNFTPEEFEKYQLEYGDILLNEGQSPELVGRPAMFRGEVEGACFQNTLVRFKAYEPMNRDYALIYFLACLHMGWFRKIASQTVNIAHLGAKRFSEMRFPLPPLAEQEAIVEEVERRLSVVDAVAAEVDQQLVRAGHLRRAILQHAFEGKLVSQEAEVGGDGALSPPGKQLVLDV